MSKTPKKTVIDNRSKKAENKATPSPLNNHQLVVPGPGRPKGSKNKATKDRKLQAIGWKMLTRLQKLLTRVENTLEEDLSTEKISLLLKLAAEIRGWIQELAKILGTYAPKTDIHVEVKLIRTEVVQYLGAMLPRAMFQSGITKKQVTESMDNFQRMIEAGE